MKGGLAARGGAMAKAVPAVKDASIPVATAARQANDLWCPRSVIIKVLCMVRKAYGAGPNQCVRRG